VRMGGLFDRWLLVMGLNNSYETRQRRCLLDSVPRCIADCNYNFLLLLARDSNWRGSMSLCMGQGQGVWAWLAVSHTIVV
jgi:hypothetical protein